MVKPLDGFLTKIKDELIGWFSRSVVKGFLTYKQPLFLVALIIPRYISHGRSGSWQNTEDIWKRYALVSSLHSHAHTLIDSSFRTHGFYVLSPWSRLRSHSLHLTVCRIPFQGSTVASAGFLCIVMTAVPLVATFLYAIMSILPALWRLWSGSEVNQSYRTSRGRFSKTSDPGLKSF